MNDQWSHAENLVTLVLTHRLYQTCLLQEFKMSLYEVGFKLRCIQLLSLGAWLPGLPYRITGGLEAPNLCSSRTKGFFLSDILANPVDIKQTVSQRSEPSSRSLLMGEHPHPWLLLHSQDRKSRHRCSKPRRRYELLGATTLLSPE